MLIGKRTAGSRNFGDKWLTACSEDAGFSKPELLDLNKVRLHKQVLFLSDFLSVDGIYNFFKNLTKRRPEEKWSRCVFPHERPSVADL